MDDPPHQLSGDICALLQSSVRTALRDVPNAPGQTALAIAESVNAYVHSCVSEVLLHHNAAHSMQKRLPAEIWCAIWERLPFFDRVRLLHVCRAWRAVALNTPAMWSRILCFSTIHGDDCDCFDCRGGDKEDDLPHWPGNPYPQRATNVHDISRYLSLGRNVDLHLSVDLVEYKPGDQVIHSLAQACNPHASRLVTIHWRSGQHKCLQPFLSRLTLSSVRNITVDWLCREDEGWLEYGSSDVANDIDFSALAYLRIDDRHFRFDGAHANLLALRSLTFCPCSCKEITTALLVCPSLSTLQAHLSRFYNNDSWWAAPHDVEGLRRAVRKSSSVAFIIGHIDTDAESWALSSFSEAAALSLVYQHFRGFRGCEMFGDLTGTVHLTWQSTSEGPSARAVDSAGRTRQLTVSLEFGSWKELNPIYEILTPTSIASLTVDTSLWAAVASGLPEGLRATSVVLTIRSREDLASQMAGPLTAALLPVLETVHITSDPERDPPLGMDDIASLIPRLGLALPLAHVIVGRRIASRNERLPLELAVRTSVE